MLAYRPPAVAKLPATTTHVPDYLASLNAQQRLAVEHGVGPTANDRGPLLIIAGAGSGKTSTLACRAAHLIANGADPQRILLLTFSRRAAEALERRAGQFLHRVPGVASARQPGTLPWAGTFHSVGARLLRQYAERIGLNDSFSILDRGDAEDLLDIVRHDLGLSATKRRFPAKGTCIAIYSRVVNGEAALDDVLAQAYPWCAQWSTELAKLFEAYVMAKQAQNVLDYDDLLLYWTHMLAEPSIARDVGDRFDHVLVDEYQDTNRVQSSILLALKPDGRGITVVGDDAQSIYSFRAATVRNILDFPQHFQPAARVVTLERNYRSTQPILDASNAVIGLAPERFTKNLWTDRASGKKPRLVTTRDEAAQACYVADRVLEERESGTALKSQAVLFRSSSHSAQLELELARRAIPFVKYGGLRFLEAAHVKDVLAMLKWANNPRNRMAGFRALRLLPGVGPARATRFLDALSELPDLRSAMESFTPPAALAADWSALAALLRALGESKPSWPADIDAVIRWYEPHFERIFDDAFVRRGDLVQLQQIASTYPSRERFLTELTLDPPDATSDEAGPPGRDDDYLILSTIHSAKGQEWKAVHVLNVVDGCIPSDMATGSTEEVEEERRLLYVAMTRAKETLELVSPQRFFVRQQSAHGDRHVYALRSRFIPDALTEFFESCASPVVTSLAEPAVASGKESSAPVDIAARVRARWSGPQ
ncbi:MAG TPA: ATP-dependent helicase [Casimicrobiaceae bacterium]|nr:ATP-dependent helicase [Casimicrobiaceae bacterium]